MHSSARVPGSLRRPLQDALTVAETLRRGQARVDVNRTKLVTAACLLAASPTSVAIAQSASSTSPLPPLSVEANSAKKRAVSSTSATAGSAAPTPAPEPSPEQKAASPYVNPVAPYMVEQSGSSKITEPLADTPKTITAISKEVLEDKAVTSVRELARQTPGVTIGFAEGGNAFGNSIYIRGFNARGDIFVDGMRDPATLRVKPSPSSRSRSTKARAAPSPDAVSPGGPSTSSPRSRTKSIISAKCRPCSEPIRRCERRSTSIR